MSQPKYAHLLLIILLGLVGFWLAPTDLPQGAYLARIAVTVAGESLSLEYPFTLGEQEGGPITLQVQQGEYHLLVEGQEAFRYALDRRITYRLQLRDATGQPIVLPLDAATSTLVGPGYEQFLPATQRDGTWLLFTMRLPYKAQTVMALLFVMAALWLTELVPLAAGAILIPVVAVLARVSDPESILQPFAHPIIMLFLAGFLMAEGMRRTGLDRRVALTILRHASLKPPLLMLTMMSLTAFLSMWMSNTASIAILIPIALAVLEKFPDDAGQKNFRRALILGIAYAATVGGVGSAIGTPANILALTFLNEYTPTALTFVDWFWYGLPMVILMVPLIWLYLLLTFGVSLREPAVQLDWASYEQEETTTERRQGQQLIGLLFVLIVGLWLTESWHQIPATIVAMGGAFLLFLFGLIRQEDLNRINWNALLTFGGGLAIGTLLVRSGVSDWIALQLMGLAMLPPLVVVFLVASLTLLTGAFISNTACAAMLIPLAIPLAQLLHLDPRLLVVVVAIGSSLDFALVVGTPPTMMAYSTGFFTTREIFKRGLLLDLLAVLLLSLGVIWIWRLFGVVTF